MALIFWKPVFVSLFYLYLYLGILTSMLSFPVPHVPTWKLASSTDASQGPGHHSGGIALKRLSQALFFHFTQLHLSRFNHTT